MSNEYSSKISPTMTTATNKRSRNKCTSCRNLRIKCDEVKPTCEYCLSTNRECVYNEVVKRKYVRKKREENNQVIRNYRFVYSYFIEKTNGLECQRYQGSLNSITNQLNLTRFEGQLLYYFHGVYLMSTISKAPCQKMWLTEIPSMWHESEWLRKCIFSTSIMFIGNSSNLERHIHDSSDKGIDLISSMALPRSDNHFGKIIPYLHESINQDGYLEITNIYFLSALNHSRNQVAKLVLGININSEFQAAENYFTAVLLYLTLILHPRKLFPVIASDEQGLDLILICQGIKILMEASFPLLYLNQVKYSTIFAFPRLDPYAIYLIHYPLIEELRISLSFYSKEISDNELETYKDALDVLQTIIYQMIEKSSPATLPYWLFLVQDEFYDYIKVKKAFFAKKLIYVFSCLCLMSNLCLESKSSIFLDYMEDFKIYNYENFGGWRDYEDSCFFTIVTNSFALVDFNALNNFLPSQFV